MDTCDEFTSDVDMIDLSVMDTNDEYTNDLTSVNIDDSMTNPYSDFVYVDVQGFRTYRNRFICKEFCLVDGDYIFHTFVKSPYSFNKMPQYYQRQANWLINRHHGIKYDYGDMDAMNLKQQIFPKLKDKTIIVNDSCHKIHWLKYMFRHFGEINVIDINTLNFDRNLRSSDPYAICDYHNKIFGWKEGPCAMSTALMLQDLACKNVDVATSSETQEEEVEY